jgi:hypothetical protein
VLVTQFVRDAESKLNAELRIDRMIQSDQALITSRCAPLPDDWLEFDLVLIADATLASGWRPLRYLPRDEFFKWPDQAYTTTHSSSNSTWGKYTIEGRQIYVGGPPDAVNGNTIQINYYGEVPVFSDTVNSWVYTKFPSLYRYAALINADLHAVGEENQAQMLKQLAEDMIQKLNMAHRYSRASGSKLARSRMRSFG